MVQQKEKRKKPELKVSPKTTAIVMSLVTQTETPIKIPSPNTLFKLFRAINSQYAWSTNLTLSLKQLELVGFLKPCTLLVCGSSVHINSLHKAWINNQIVGPAGYQVNCLGE